MTAIERLILEIVGGLLLVCGTFLYIEHRGAAQCRADNAASVVQQEAANQARAVIETKEINQEAMQYHDAISAAPMPSPAVVCVRYFTPPTVPKATPTASGTHGAVQVPAGDYRPVFDPAAGARIDQPAAKIGQRCDAQGNGLEAYIRDVVRPQ